MWLMSTSEAVTEDGEEQLRFALPPAGVSRIIAHCAHRAHYHAERCGHRGSLTVARCHPVTARSLAPDLAPGRDLAGRCKVRHGAIWQFW
jgi:hypothetical protein